MANLDQPIPLTPMTAEGHMAWDVSGVSVTAEDVRKAARILEAVAMWENQQIDYDWNTREPALEAAVQPYTAQHLRMVANTWDRNIKVNALAVSSSRPPVRRSTECSTSTAPVVLR